MSDYNAVYPPGRVQEKKKQGDDAELGLLMAPITSD